MEEVGESDYLKKLLELQKRCLVAERKNNHLEESFRTLYDTFKSRYKENPKNTDAGEISYMMGCLIGEVPTDVHFAPNKLLFNKWSMWEWLMCDEPNVTVDNPGTPNITKTPQK